MPQSTDEKWELNFLHSYLESAASSINAYSNLFHAHVSYSGSTPQLTITKK